MEQLILETQFISANINGLPDDSDTVNAFSKNLSNIYFDSYDDKAETSKYVDGLQSNLLSEFSSNIDTRSVFDVCDVEKILNKLKISKACGLDNITKEFVMYSRPAIVVHLKLLFNITVHHGFVPDSFGNEVIIPLVKDKQGDLCNIDNYRAITWSSFFEHCILDKYDYLMSSNYLQFGFKKHFSCSQPFLC